MNVLNVMSLLIELLGNQMKPSLGTLLQLLPALWDASQDHYLLRCAIISTLVHVVKVIVENYYCFPLYQIFNCLIFLGSWKQHGGAASLPSPCSYL